MLGAVSSVLRIHDSKSNLISDQPSNETPFIKTKVKFNSGEDFASRQILIDENRLSKEDPYQAATEVSSLLPNIVNNARVSEKFRSNYRRDQMNQNLNKMSSGDFNARRESGLSGLLSGPDSPSKMVKSRGGDFSITKDYIDKR